MNGSSELDSFHSLTEVRDEIDRIDREIVGLIGKRSLCVKAAARFKTDETAVAAPERFAAMLTVRKEWAEAAGLDPDMVEELYRNMVTRFIAEEKTTGGRRNSQSHLRTIPSSTEQRLGSPRPALI